MGWLGAVYHKPLITATYLSNSSLFDFYAVGMVKTVSTNEKASSGLRASKCLQEFMPVDVTHRTVVIKRGQAQSLSCPSQVCNPSLYYLKMWKMIVNTTITMSIYE